MSVKFLFIKDRQRMKLEHNKVYKVIKENTSRSILVNDLIYIDDNGVLVIHKSGELAPSVAHVFLEKNKQTQSSMDFECVCVD